LKEDSMDLKAADGFTTTRPVRRLDLSRPVPPG
jgi:hypothetical protein